MKTENSELKTPYLSSTKWYRAFLEGVVLPADRPNRSRIAGGQMLSVPVAGSTTAIKRKPYRELELSDHGDWRRIHLGAITAAYGKAPYFQHLMPELAGVIESPHQYLWQLNEALHEVVMRWLWPPGQRDGFLQMRRQRPRLFAALLQQHKLTDEEYNLSVIHPLMYLGKEAAFAVLPF